MQGLCYTGQEYLERFPAAALPLHSSMCIFNIVTPRRVSDGLGSVNPLVGEKQAVDLGINHGHNALFTKSELPAAHKTAKVDLHGR